jgi:transcriptional regulator with XRE-family HTH domain
MDLRQLFATNLRRLRHERKISQEQLAHDAEVDRAYLSRVERAVTYVGLEIIEKLAAIWKLTRLSFSGGPPGPAPARRPNKQPAGLVSLPD